MRLKFCATAAAFSLMLSQPALAYVGPGLGLGTLGAILGVIISVLLAIVGIVWYPMKRLLRRMRTKHDAPIDEQGTDSEHNPQIEEQGKDLEHDN